MVKHHVSRANYTLQSSQLWSTILHHVTLRLITNKNQSTKSRISRACDTNALVTHFNYYWLRISWGGGEGGVRTCIKWTGCFLKGLDETFQGTGSLSERSLTKHNQGTKRPADILVIPFFDIPTELSYRRNHSECYDEKSVELIEFKERSVVVVATKPFAFNVIHKLKHNKSNPIARNFTTFLI